MHPKETAIELIEDMLHFQKGSDIGSSYELARLSADYVAMKCKNVAFILDYENTHDDFKYHSSQFWEQVQKELKELK